MVTSFFIDESGHGGDAVRSGVAHDFLDQPIFVLAAVGTDSEAELAQSIESIRASHRVPTGELKSVSARPASAVELLTHISDSRLPIFVEVVDKKYFLCAHLINSQLMPPVLGYEESRSTHYIKNQLAEFLYEEVSDHVLDRFIQSCTEPSDHSLMSSFGSQLLFTAGDSTTSEAQMRRSAMHDMIIESMKEYVELRENDAQAHLRFLPSPDLNKFSKHVWMLPNLSSFTNIYARINLFRRKRLADVRLVHDQQLEVDDILRAAKVAAESIRDAAQQPFTPHSDYVFSEVAALEFVDSRSSLGVQVADVVAGTFMRFYRDRLHGRESPWSKTESAVRRLARESSAATGVGVNQFVPARLTL
jgi:hypothetical protein